MVFRIIVGTFTTISFIFSCAYCWRYAVDVRTYAHAHHAFLKQFCAVGQSRRTHTHTHIDGWTVTTDTRALRSGLAWSTIMSFGKVQTSNGQRTVHERPLSVDFPAWVPRWISVDSAEISENPDLLRQCLTRIFRNFGRVPGNPHATRNDANFK